jgi:hypothetical protein
MHGGERIVAEQIADGAGAEGTLHVVDGFTVGDGDDLGGDRPGAAQAFDPGPALRAGQCIAREQDAWRALGEAGLGGFQIVAFVENHHARAAGQALAEAVAVGLISIDDADGDEGVTCHGGWRRGCCCSDPPAYRAPPETGITQLRKLPCLGDAFICQREEIEKRANQACHSKCIIFRQPGLVSAADRAIRVVWLVASGTCSQDKSEKIRHCRTCASPDPVRSLPAVKSDEHMMIAMFSVASSYMAEESTRLWSANLFPHYDAFDVSDLFPRARHVFFKGIFLFVRK